MRTVSLLTFILLASQFCSAGMVWLQTVHNFGAFSEDLNEVHCTFRAVNTGDSPVSVVSARANCGCTVARYTKDAVAPGDTLTVNVDYNAVGRPGRFNKKVFIETSDGDKATLVVSGIVIGNTATLSNRYPVEAGRVRLSRSAVLFGSTVKGHSMAGGINIYNSSSAPIRPKVSDLPDYIKASFRPAEIAVGEQGVLSLTANTATVDEWGTVRGSFLLTPDPSSPSDTIRISTVMLLREDFSKLTPEQLAKAPAAKLSTTSIDYDRIEGTFPIKRTFSITNTGKSPLVIRKATCESKAVDIRLSTTRVAPGKKAVVTVTLRPSMLEADQPLNERIELVLNAPDTPTATVRLVGTLK